MGYLRRRRRPDNVPHGEPGTSAAVQRCAMSVRAAPAIAEQLMDFDRALEYIPKYAEGRQIYLGVSIFMPFKIQNPSKDKAQGVNGYDYVPVTLARTLTYLKCAVPSHWRFQLGVRVKVTQNCIFIGERPP